MNALIIFSFSAIIILSCKENKSSEKQKTVKSRHSVVFNKAIDSMMNAYYALSEAFVNWDSGLLPSRALSFHQTLKIPFDELVGNNNADVAIKAANLEGEVRDKLTPILPDTHNNITIKRQAFNSVTNSLYKFLDFIKYDEKKLYLNECTMPYNDTGSGVWLSNTETLRNPYLGLHHPKYKSGMLECGINKATIDFRPKEK